MITSEAVFALIVPGLFAGIGLLLAGKFLPDMFTQYKIPATILGLFLVVFFVFQSGRYNEFSKWKLKNSEQQVEIAMLKAKSAEINVEIITKYVDKIKYVDRIKEIKVYEFITKEADVQCVISPSTSDNIRMLVNSSIKGELPGSPISVDVTTEQTIRTTK